jgi:hypothetical protein
MLRSGPDQPYFGTQSMGVTFEADATHPKGGWHCMGEKGKDSSWAFARC